MDRFRTNVLLLRNSIFKHLRQFLSTSHLESPQPCDTDNWWSMDAVLTCHFTDRSVARRHIPLMNATVRLAVAYRWVCLTADCGSKVSSFGQWAAANCAALPIANAGQ